MSFDQLAPHYRRLEHVLAGRVLQRARLAFLPALDDAEHVLLAGEGPGRFLEALRARRPAVEITVVDASPAMLQAARAAIPDTDQRTHFQVADLRQWRPPAGAFDAIVTSCVLDCFEAATVGDMVTRLGAAARPQAWWLHIDFAIPAAGIVRRARAQFIHRLMYAVFRRTTSIDARQVTPPDRWLEEAGFARRAFREFSAGLVRSELWERERTFGA